MFVTFVLEFSRSPHPCEQRLYGCQFHPEVDLSVNGLAMMENFLVNVAGVSRSFTMERREVRCIEEIRRLVGTNKVLLLVSGGVDSTVCAALLHKALEPDQVYAVHIDNGFMRKNESAQVEESLKTLGLNLRVVHAWYQFYNGTTMIPMKPEEVPEGEERKTGQFDNQTAVSLFLSIFLSIFSLFLSFSVCLFFFLFLF